MKNSTIQFEIALDDQNVPEVIKWDASEKPEGGLSESKSISLSIWDHHEKSTLRIDLWTKDMPVDDLKRFYVDCIGGLSQSLLKATGDEFMANEMNQLCDKLVHHMKKNP